MLKIEVCSCAAILKKKTTKNNSRFQVFEFPILVSWLIDAVSAFIPPRKGLWRLTPMMETFELFQNNRSASKYLPLTVNASTKLSPLLKQLLERKTRSDLIDLFFSDLPKRLAKGRAYCSQVISYRCY